MAEIKLELNQNEEKGYYSLLAFSQLSIGEFCFYNKFDHKEGLDVLSSLKEKKLAVEVKGLTDRYIPQFPFLDIANKFVEPAQKFNDLKTNLQSFFQTKEKEIADIQQTKIKEVNDAINPKISDLQNTDTTLKRNADKAKSDLNGEMKNTDELFTAKLAEDRTKSKSNFTGKKDALVTLTIQKGSETEQKVLADSKSLKDSTNALVIDFFDQIDKSIFNELIKSFDSLKASITALNGDLESLEKKFNVDSTNWISDSESKVNTSLNSSKDTFSKFILDLKANLSEEQDALQLLNLEFTDLKKFQASKSPLIIPFVNLRKVLDDSRDSLNKVRDEFNSQITELIQTDTNNTKETMEKSKNGLNQSFATMLEARSKQGENTANQLTESHIQNVTTAQEFIKGHNDQVAQLQSTTASAVSTTKNNLLEKHSSATQEANGHIENIQSNIIPEIATSVTKWNDSFKNTFTTVTQITNEQYDDIHQTLDQMMGDVKNQYEENTKHIQELLSKQSDLLQKKFSDLQAQIPPKKANSIDAFNTVNSQVATEISNLHKMLESQINSVKTLVETHRKSILTELPKKVSNDLDTISSSMTQHAESLKTQLTTFFSDWTTKAKEFTDNWIELETQLRSAEATTLKNSNTSINSELDALTKKASELRVDLITKAKDKNKTLNESLNTAVKSNSENLSKSLTETLTFLNNNANEFNTKSDAMHSEQITSMKQSYDGVRNSLAELMQNARSETDTKLQEQATGIDQSTKAAHESYNSNKGSFLTTVTSSLDQTFANIDKSNQDYYKSLLNSQNGFITEMGTLIDTFESSLSDLTINQMKGLITSLQEKFELFNRTQELLTSSIAGFIATESTIRQSLTQGVDEQAKSLKTNLQDHAGEFEKLAKVGEDLLTPPSSLLGRFNQLVKEYTYPQIESLGIIGWSGSIVQVQNMIKAMKTRVTLLVPNPKDLDNLMDSITNAKRPKRVDISCQFDMNNKEHVQLIRKLLNQDNVTLRSIEIGKIGGTETKYPPFLAVDRDGEEVMFGTQDPNDKTAFVGMVSQVSSFIELMGKVVLSDFLSKGKKINQGDV